MSLEELFANSSINVPDMLQHLKKTADTLGLPFGDRTKTYNSRLAQELGLWAESQNKGDAFHMAAFLAYFAKGKNLARQEILLNLIKSIDLNEHEAKKVLEERTFKDAVDADWQLARTLGVTAVPTFIMDQERVVGAQPYEKLEKFITGVGVMRR